METRYILQKLKKYLQIAIEVEHATLPPYLTAYWSIYGKSPEAKKASALLLSVIREEMLHMGMACNILNAIGGKPAINGKKFIPSFPCNLPGHSHTVNPFIVHLSPCTAQAIKTFMLIELPERIVVEREQRKKWATIGQFYEEIIALINNPSLTDNDFKHGRQLDNKVNPATGTLYTVECRADAIRAINEILDQGEGHNPKSHYDADHELTHYWRFNEIFQLISSGKWKIENEVYPVAPDPDELYFNKEAKQLNKKFNSIYSKMLDGLHDTYNGNGNINTAIHFMLELETVASSIMQIPLTGREGNASPTFKYLDKHEHPQ